MFWFRRDRFKWGYDRMGGAWLEMGTLGRCVFIAVVVAIICMPIVYPAPWAWAIRKLLLAVAFVWWFFYVQIRDLKRMLW